MTQKYQEDTDMCYQIIETFNKKKIKKKCEIVYLNL